MLYLAQKFIEFFQKNVYVHIKLYIYTALLRSISIG